MAGFRKNKRKKPFTPPTAATVNPNAATAATAAFSLSSAAAGAALRALPAPKTNVAEVQTKRTMRRSASVSSQGSRRAMSPVPSIKRMMGIGARGAADGGPVRSAAPPPTLRRRGSASSLASMASVTSMSDRTFRTRTPSPGRAARGSVARASVAPSSPGSSIASSRTTTASTAVTAAGAAAAAAAGRTGKGNRSQSMPPPPPVPSIPKHVAAAASAADAKQTQAKQQPKQNRKSLQLAQQPLRLASEQQQAKATSGRGSWFGGATVGNLADVRKSDLAMDISNYGNKTSITPPDERPSSRASSINFSYPSRQRLASPPASPTTTDKPISPPAAAQAVSRSMSTERPSTQHTAPRHKPAQGGASGRRSASMSRVTDRTTTAHASGQTLVYDPNSRRFVPRAELLLEQSLAEAAEHSERQQHKKQQRHSTSAALLAGSHEAQEASPKAHKIAPPPTRKQPELKQRQAPKPEAVATASPPRQQKQQRRPQSNQQDPAQATEEESARPPRESTRTVPLLATSQTGTESTAAALDRADADATVHGGDHEASHTADSGRPALVKRPSVVREETEREMEEDKQNERLRLKRSSVALAQGPESSGSPSRNDTHLVAVPNGQGDITGNSPDSHLSVRRHSPPPRSISPRKSAMKHSSSPRDVSPSDSASDANPASLALQSTSALSVQGAAARKKAHRVSFDEKAVVVPQESSQKPTFSSLPGAPESLASANGNHSPSPQRRTWFSNIGRSKKKGAELAAAAAGTAYLASSPFSGADGQDEDDEIMKPRPALPSFGSVREKAQHAHAPPQEERPLVRPVHTTPSPSARSPTDTPASTPPPRGASRSPVADAPLGQHLETQGTSSDHAIGSILVSSLAGSSLEGQTSGTAAATRNTANTSRYREPLPPVVTSVDGSGYASDSGASSASIEKEAENALLADDDESESNVGVAAGASVPRFDETRTTSYPTVLPAVIAEVPSDEEDTPALETSTTEASTAKASKKVVPAIAITHPSQENLVAVRGEEGEEGGEEEQDSPNTKEAAETLSQTPAPPPTRHSPVRAFFDVPGMFPPDSDSDSTNKASPTKAVFGLGESTAVPTRQDTFEPIAQNDDSTVTAYTPATVYATHMPTLHEESSLHEQSHDEAGRGDYGKDSEDSEDNSERDNESIYSDAYEDLSDAEGDGFQSLDAVVDSPISLDSKSHPFALPPALPSGPPSPKTKKALLAADGGADAYGGNSVAANAWHASTGAGAKTSAAGGVPETNNAGDADWEKVRVFWHSLSSERRAQLEREASERTAKEEAAADGDLEEPTAAKKARRKKSAETRLAEKKALKDLVARNEGPHPAPPPQPQARNGQPPSPKKISKRLRPSMRETAAGAAGGGVVAASATTPAVASNAQRARPGEADESGRPPSAGGAVRTGHNRTLSSDSTSSSLLQKQKQSFLSGALRRRGSDSSESSFKRARGSSGGGGGGAQSDVGVGMRRTMRGESLDRGSSRFSLRSLSPTGSTTLRGGPAASGHAQSPHMPLTLRDKPAGAAAGREKRALSASMTSATMRSHSVGAGDGGNRLLPSLGRKGGSKLVRRGSSSRFGDSSDEDGDIFNIPRPTSAGLASGAAAGASRRSASVGGATRAFRSRFDDSSDEDEIILDSRLRAAARQNRSTQRHVVPRTLRTGGLRGSSSVGGGGGGGGGGLSSRSLRSSDGGRPASRGGLSKRPMLPEALEEEEEEEGEHYNRQTALRPDEYMLRTPSGNIGTSTLRRSRSGRGQILPAAHSPTLSSSAMGAGGSGTRSTLRGKDAAALQVPPSHVQHRRMSSASSIMSVLRRKKPKDDGSGVGVGSFGSTAAPMKVQRGELSDSAARRDTQLERSKQELALLRSNSQRRRQRLQRSGRAADDDDDDDPDSDSDLDSDLDSDGGAVNGAKKNGAKGAQAGGSWPLTGAGAGSSSGGAKAKNSAGGMVSAGGVVINGSGVPVKKKKFPALRRMFRLED